MQKLTLRLDGDLVKKAKSVSKKSGKSVSRMVADYFVLLDRKKGEGKASPYTPLVSSLKGALRGAALDENDYRRFLEEKYIK